MLKVFRFFCFLFLFLLVFSFLYICLLCCFSGCRIKCTGEANVVPTGGDFPVVYVMQHLKGLCILEQSQLPLNRISFLLFYVPNPKVHWAWISERCGPIRRLFWLSQIVVPENILKLIVLKKKKKKESSPKTKQEQIIMVEMSVVVPWKCCAFCIFHRSAVWTNVYSSEVFVFAS